MNRPLVLAGPILRRVELNRVAVWLALRDASNVRLKVWPGIHEASATQRGEVAGSDPHPTREVEVHTVRFGERFHIALLDLKLGDLFEPDPPPPSPSLQPVLEPGTVYSYNVLITPDEADPTDLRVEGLLDERVPDLAITPQRPTGVALGYATNQLPSFATCPIDVADLFILQASCRKGAAEAPNAGQNPEFGADDLMTAFDPLIDGSLGDPRTRPHQLFLTGDQIYADETPGPLLPHLTALANELLGTDEMIPLETPPTIPLTVENFPAGARQKLCSESAKFTSSSASSHVIGLGEYYASYLVAWSEACWDDLTDELPSVDASVVRDKITDWEECIRSFEQAELVATDARTKARAKEEQETAKKDHQNSKRGFRNQRKRIEGYRINVPIVRRVLANVPSYMMFDDHEITDDWNITQQWRNRVLTTDLGSTILRNGLVAYAVCQGWGNDPGAWEEKKDGSPKSPNKELIDNAAELFATPSINATARDKIDDLLGHAASTIKVTWNYAIDFESHRVVVLDTRNHRQLAQRHRPPGLLDPAAIGKQLASGPLPPGLDLLVVISPAPLLGPAASDHVVQPLGALALDAKSALEFGGEFDPCTGKALDPFEGQTTVDLESWFADDDAFEGLLKRLATYKDAPIVVLSGDVHYGLSAVIDYWKKAGAAGGFAQTRIVQFTSSAARNVWPDKLQTVLTITRQFVPAQRALLSLKDPTERLGWFDNVPPPVAGAGDAVRPLRTRLRGNPVLVPAGGWPQAAAEQQPPDWAWRMQLVADVRSDDGTIPDSRPDQVRPPPPPEFDAADPVGSYQKAVARHALAAATNIQVRTMVAEFNVGGLRFRRDPGGQLIARGELYSRNHKHRPDPTPAANTVHEVPLSPTTDERPTVGA